MESLAVEMEQAPSGASGRIRGDDEGSRVAQETRPEAMPEPRRRAALISVGQLPRGEVEKGDHERQPRR